MGDLSNHFDRSEFVCKCGCGFNDVDKRLIDALEGIRGLYGKPITITSGCRCSKHNEAEGGKPDSAHTRGLAADIRTEDSQERYMLLLLCLSRFKRIGIAKGFIHVDIDTSKSQDVCWMY